MTTEPTNPSGGAVAPERGTPEYNAAMAARYDAQNAGGQTPEGATPPGEAPPTPPKPEGGLDKYYDAKTGTYNWSAHVLELNYRLEKGQTPQSQTPQSQTPAATPPAQTPDGQEAQGVVEAAGLDWSQLENQLASGQGLTEADYARLEKIVPRHIIDGYLQSMDIARDAARNMVIEYAGGEQPLNDLLVWAANNVEPAEKDRLNRVLASENWQDAIDALALRRTKASPTGRETPLITGEQGNVANGLAFTTEGEMVKAINDPRYRSDPAYRASVRNRIAASPFNPSGRR